MKISRVLCSIAVVASTQLLSWAQADDQVVSADQFTPSEEVQTNSASDEGKHEFVEDGDTTRVMSHHRRYPYSVPYVLPSPFYYPSSYYYAAPHYYPRYLEEQNASKEDGGHAVDDRQEEISTGEPAAEERDLSHRGRYSPVSYSYYYAPARYYAPVQYVPSSYPRYLKTARRAAVVDKNAAAQSKLWAASRKVRNMGHRRYGYYHVPISPYYGSYYGYRNPPYGYVRYSY
ncbi:conserved hypothetical protein [Neospora caninum Liverpool]|uniref:Uncharacterized protein n=1 Tax=Neospora caninum (strain Liverpool) TaxID=572307 RepID=F0VD66_NEOCL|nr:conserved hypothetical protein [Neospora caninum Liverpool]CBZ51581.1 conserved hypothetical protein [Neospora caninum Liverpool]CEL65531.1 TPA: hypothetical protein BN1204_013750 [Neospora caninum Liverpool]|eukprot:XP_003881614.1 conserved hypothetical protein [Neospora caninum Liverpool]